MALRSFERHLRAENKAPSTIATYAKAVEGLGSFLATHDRARSSSDLERGDVEAYLVHLHQKGHKPATVAQRFRSLQQFFKWLVEEEEIARSPMAGLRAPAIPDAPPPVLRADDLRRLLTACVGTGFVQRRDTAILRLLIPDPPTHLA